MINIPIFIPHAGCPHECSFCSQRAITGRAAAPAPAEIGGIIHDFAVKAGRLIEDCMAAFFGGSFTGLPRGLMAEYLEAAAALPIAGIRLSTRPDLIDGEVLDLLGRYNVKEIELGIQSMDDGVLAACGRGHTAADSEKACALVTGRGFGLTGQMMLGLPLSTLDSELHTARRIAGMGAKCARVYPTVAFRGTRLYDEYAAGRYTPLSLDEAVERAAAVKRVFDAAGVRVIRMGLHSGEDFADSDGFAGPWHPAFGELVESRIIFEDICGEIGDAAPKEIVIEAGAPFMSKVIGQSRTNIERLRARYPGAKVEVAAVGGVEEYRVKWW